MSGRLIPLDEVLRALTEAPLSSDALARQLGLNRLDARIVLLDAHAHGLVRTTHRGEWAISDLGLDALATNVVQDLGHRSHTDSPSHGPRRSAGWAWRSRASSADARWPTRLRPRYLAHRGVPVALGALVCAGGVALASSRFQNPSGPIVASRNIHPVHGRHAHARVKASALLAPGATGAHRHLKRSTPIVTATRSSSLGERRLRGDRQLFASACRQRHYRAQPGLATGRHPRWPAAQPAPVAGKRSVASRQAAAGGKHRTAQRCSATRPLH